MSDSDELGKLGYLHQRGILSDEVVRSKMVTSLFPQTPLSHAAPLYVDRCVRALVLYGRSVGGLDLDPDERLSLVRVMSNASIALASIELARYRPPGTQTPAWSRISDNATDIKPLHSPSGI